MPVRDNIEFLLRRNDDEWWGGAWSACNPINFPYTVIPGWGNHRILVCGVEASISDEDTFYQLSFEGPLDEDLAIQIASEMLANLERTTGRPGRLVPI